MLNVIKKKSLSLSLSVDGVYHLCQVVLKPYKSLPQYFPVITDWLDACKCSENGVANYVTHILGKPVSF